MSTGLLRFVTAGSVDDGKSTLIGRLLYDSKGLFADQVGAIEKASAKRGFSGIDLSLLTDGLVAEREQGITIDVAYRYFATPARKFIIGDSPGHVQYTRNMVTAASTADVAILLVDAARGIQAQTRRHAYLARWLGVPRVVLAVNKMDLVGGARARFEALRDEFEDFAAPLGFVEARAIPMSALRGDMVVERAPEGEASLLPWYEGPTLIEWLESVPARHDDAAARDAAAFRFPVQRVVRVARGNGQPGWEGVLSAAGALDATGEFRGYQGTVAAGRVAVGDAIVSLPSGASARVAAILGPSGAQESAQADEAVTLRLDGEIDVSRGDVFASPDARPRLADDFEADLCWFDGEPSATRPYLLKHGTRTVRARLADILHRVDVETLQQVAPPAALSMNDVAKVRLRTQGRLPLDAYAEHRAGGAFILIDEATNRTVAAGTVRA